MQYLQTAPMQDKRQIDFWRLFYVHHRGEDLPYIYARTTSSDELEVSHGRDLTVLETD